MKNFLMFLFLLKRFLYNIRFKNEEIVIWYEEI